MSFAKTRENHPASSPGLHRRRPRRRHLRLESLETRRVLTALDVSTPAIAGTTFLDLDGNGQASPNELIPGMVVRLFQDDGDGVFDPALDSPQGPGLETDANGFYCFDQLDPDEGYFVLQLQDTIAGVQYDQEVSDLIFPGFPNLPIDLFESAQTTSATPPAPSDDGTTLAFPNENEVWGRERDVLATLDSGDGEVSVSINPFGSRPTLRYNADVAVTGSAQLTWDGIDGDARTISFGLAPRDLTEGGRNAGIALRIGAVVSGSRATVRLYAGNASNFSESSLSIPVTTGGAADDYVFLSFDDFTGPVSPTSVQAITLTLDANIAGGNDIEVALIGAAGVKQANFAKTTTTDLSITKTDNQDSAVPGESLTYTIAVTNNGPSRAVQAFVTDNLPAALESPSYTSSATGSVSGNTPSGNGNINDTIDIASGASLTYVVTGRVNPGATGVLSNTATVTVPAGIIDSNLSNNSAVDVDTLRPEVDLSIVKSNNRTSVVPGDSVDYQIVVQNPGPSNAAGVAIRDTFPNSLSNVAYTSTTTGTVAGNTPSGTGDLNEIVSLNAGSSVTYNVTGNVASNANGVLSNTATVVAPAGITDRNPANNTSTHEDPLTPAADVRIVKTANQSTVEPGESLTYTIIVANDGPSDVSGVAVRDNFPSSLQNVQYVSQANGNASGNTPSGTGNISDTVNLPRASSIRYTATATLDEDAVDDVINTADVQMPTGVVDPNPGNNQSVNTVAVDIVLRSISGNVFLDQDNDGVRDPNDVPLSGVNISLDGTDFRDDPVERQTTTNANGDYVFAELHRGTYNIRQQQPEPFRDGQAIPGTGAVSGPTVSENLFANLELGRERDAVNYNFTELRPNLSKRSLFASAFRQ